MLDQQSGAEMDRLAGRRRERGEGSHAAFLRKWAKDIRASSGQSVDADRLDDISDSIEDAQREWLPIETLPPPGERPGKVFVIVEGSQFHSGVNWLRRRAGIARTQNDPPFYPEDIGRIAVEDQMDHGTERVTHWMPWCLPPFPETS